MENIMELSEIINQKVYNLSDIDFAQRCKIDLDQKEVNLPFTCLHEL